MKIERISYGKSFENAAGLWEKIGLEAVLEPGETPQQAFDQAREIIDGWHKDRNPHLYATTQGDPRWVEITDLPTTPDPEFEELKRRLGHIEFREDAISLINNNGFRLNVELNKIANAKPSRPTVD